MVHCARLRQAGREFVSAEELNAAEVAVLKLVQEQAEQGQPVRPDQVIQAVVDQGFSDQVARAAVWELIDWKRLQWAGNNTLTVLSREPLPTAVW
jgi:hypothetical protein